MAQNEVRYKFTAEDSQFKKVAGNVGSELKKMAKDGTLGVAALTTAFYALGRSMQDTLNTMDQISKMSSKTGFSTESLSALKYAADLSGVSLESLEKSFIKLSKSVDANSGAFSKINVDLKSTNGTLKSNETILMDVADAFAGMEDGAQKTAIATDIFGKAGADMIPLLNGGSEAIRNQMTEAERLGITFDTLSAQKAERFNDSITTLTYTAKGFTQELVVSLLPAFDSLSATFESTSGSAIEAGSAFSPLILIARGIAMAFHLAASSIMWAGNVISLVIRAVWDAMKLMGGLAAGFAALAKGDIPSAMAIFSSTTSNPFAGTMVGWEKLMSTGANIFNSATKIATGSTTYGMSDAEINAFANSNLPKNKSGLSDEDGKDGKVPTTTSGKTKVIDELKEFEQSKKDAMEVIELSWSQWQIENIEVTNDAKLRAEREYLQRRLTLLEQYKGSDSFGNLSTSEQTSTNNEILNLKNELQQLNLNLKKLGDDAFKLTPLGRLGSQDDFAKIFGMSGAEIDAMQKTKISDKTKGFIERTQKLRDENPAYETTVFDSINNQQSKLTGDYNTSSNSLSKEWLDIESGINAEIQRLLDGGATKDSVSVIAYNNLKLDAHKSFLETKLRFDQNYKDASEELDRQSAEAKISILSDALGTIGGIFTENTLAYQALVSAQVIMDTYAAATKALLLPPPFGEIQAAAVIAMGLANMQKIWSIPIPKFAKGGLVSQPQLSLLGEAGPEFIAPQKDFVSYTKQIIRSVENQKATTGFVGNLKLRGNDLVVAVERASQMRGRLGT